MILDRRNMDTAYPHTIKKFELITQYVDNWARKILGYQDSQGVVYIDCMSNCGLYLDENGDGVEGTAVRVIKRLNDIMKNSEYAGKKAIVFFNDLDAKRIEFLKNYIDKYVDVENLEIHFSVLDASEFLKRFPLRKYCKYNVFLVYDPYKAIIDWSAIKPFMNIWGEIIINHMIYDTKRGLIVAKNDNVINKYEGTYNQNINEILRNGKNYECLNDRILDIIEELSSSISKEHFVASFPFFNRKNGCIYTLIHFSKHIKGFILFKKIAWQTFGGKSSLKQISTGGNQLGLFDGISDDKEISNVNNSCLTVEDIGKAVFEKYNSRKEVPLGEIYNWLDYHRVFPSDGFKDEIKKYLRERYLVTTKRNSIMFGGTD